MVVCDFLLFVFHVFDYANYLIFARMSFFLCSMPESISSL